MQFSKQLTLSFLTVIIFLFGCGRDMPPDLKSESELKVKIGHAAPLTGTQANLGQDNEGGAILAIEEANASGIVIGGKKIQFQLLSEDDQADPRIGTIVD